MSITKVRTVCGALGRATLRGNREDWGEDSENLFQMLKFLTTAFGEQVVEIELGDNSGPAVLAALRSIGAPHQEIAHGLAILERRLVAPFRPIELS